MVDYGSIEHFGNNMSDAVSTLWWFFGRSKQDRNKLFSNLVDAFQSPEVKYETPSRAFAIAVFDEIRRHSFRALGRLDRYYVRDKNGGLTLVNCSDLYDSLAKKYPEMKFLGKNK